MAASEASQATRGGCAFHQLCNGSVQSYACDNVIDITKNEDGCTPTIQETEQMLLKHVHRCIQSIETERGCKLEKFYIGKTHVRQRANRKFNHMDCNTWRLDNGINGRHRSHVKNDYGRDGLVVLTVVTRDAIPPDIHVNKPNFHQENYALALEGRLIQDFLDDPRLSNETCETGRRDSTPSIGYPLYMAFKVHNGCKSIAIIRSCFCMLPQLLLMLYYMTYCNLLSPLPPDTTYHQVKDEHSPQLTTEQPTSEQPSLEQPLSDEKGVIDAFENLKL